MSKTVVADIMENMEGAFLLAVPAGDSVPGDVHVAIGRDRLTLHRRDGEAYLIENVDSSVCERMARTDEIMVAETGKDGVQTAYMASVATH